MGVVNALPPDIHGEALVRLRPASIDEAIGRSSQRRGVVLRVAAAHGSDVTRSAGITRARRVAPHGAMRHRCGQERAAEEHHRGHEHRDRVAERRETDARQAPQHGQDPGNDRRA